MAALRSYRAKRDFAKTPEPRGKARGKRGFSYVIQKHAARQLHYDLRLELDGAMKSWAVTRGPSLVPGEKRLAVHVEDHPIEYNAFEGTIPKGEYGGGTVMVWDRGRWTPEGDPHKAYKKGHLDFQIDGKKLKGRWHLVRMRKRAGERQDSWLLIKSDDEYARRPSEPDILKEEPDSAATGRTMDEIAQARRKKIWHSDKPEKAKTSAPRKQSAPTKKPRARSKRTGSAAKSKSRSKARAKGGRSKLPGFVPPSLATLVLSPPSTGRWLHEIKFDGYRIQALIADRHVALKTRTGLDWTKKFPAIADALNAVAPRTAVIDGEIVSVNESGVSDFSALQADLKSARQDRLLYFAFDLLHLDGADLTGAPLTDRKRLLAQLLSGLPKDGAIRLSEDFETDAKLMLRHACKLGLEGIVSKRGDAPYRSGRSGNWIKLKCTASQEFVVAGYEPSDKRGRAIRSLLLAYKDEGEWRYAGRVGTGWDAAEERDLLRGLTPSKRKTPPIATIASVERPGNVVWTEPRVVVEAEFRGWTADRLVRQASYKGIRRDKPAAQVVREIGIMPSRTENQAAKPRQAAMRKRSPKKTAAVGRQRKDSASVAGVRLTHPERVYWKDAGITKRMLAEYYAEVWDWIGPHVTGRVLALVRCPEGASSQCFFQKHASAGIDTAHLHLVPEPGGKTSISLGRLSGLIALAQAGVLEIHRRGSTVKRLEHAERLVFDLDPGPGVEWRDVVGAAREVRRRLSRHKLMSFPMSTGGNGLHVVVPIRSAPWDAAKEFCRRVANDMATDEPGRYTANVKKSARRGRIFVDYLRNSREATAIAPYSTRARPGATVAVPLAWDELSGRKADNTFDIRSVRRRLSRLRREPWHDFAPSRRTIPKAGSEPAA